MSQLGAWILLIVLTVVNGWPLTRPERVTMRLEHVRGIQHAALRTHISDLEEFYCLVGVAGRDGNYIIAGIVMPWQKAVRDTVVEGQNMNMVIAAACPPGTIGDLHTHPSGDATPSWNVDIPNWNENRLYSLHIIAFIYQNRFDQVGLAAYDYSDPEHPRGLAEGWLQIGGD